MGDEYFICVWVDFEFTVGLLLYIDVEVDSYISVNLKDWSVSCGVVE